MKNRLIGIFCLLALLLASSGCVADEEPATRPTSQEILGIYLHDAAVYAADVGKDAALAEFGRLDGEFTSGSWYVYAYDTECNLLAHPYEPQSVGLDRLGWTDSRGMPVIRIARDVAAAGGGYIVYLYPEPVDGVIDEAAVETYKPKLGYVLPAGDGWWIGSGVALENSDGTYPPAIQEMIELVHGGVSYAQAQGKVAAIAELSDLNGQFVDSDGHYLYAYLYDGTLIGHPYLPEKIGSNLINREDQYGMRMIAALAETAEDGGGFVVFIWPNPDEGNRDELKIGYVMPVDDEWWLGSGVYLSEVTGEYTRLTV
ncbi:MAG: cache domain-containing protein [Methanocalculus sp.]|uniref:cache domain-containing protein n=1 Tax=Methanocalculus sp. TaxID=2004547 RepID=UPI002721256A|nr:cache domain-containing protein [Methanocalculus sp.]MDO9539673.1 cache domain-containing protein [Methanocalculus sp.]